jgi:hypothetical protein
MALFGQLTGARIVVHVEQRAARKRNNVRGVFRPALLHTAQAELQDNRFLEISEVPDVEVWLRKPPKRDQLANRVHQLVDVDELGYREAAIVLQADGHRMNSDVVRQIRQRYFEMIGQPMPPVPYNNGRPRAGRRPST